MSVHSLTQEIRSGDHRALARAISLVENDAPGHAELLESLAPKSVPITGLTGSPGAGKSTLLDGILNHLTTQGKRVAVIAVDPSSPFTRGALLGDRIRMSRHFDSPNVFIRSLATRGTLGGLPAKCIEVCDVLRESVFDHIFIETVGVGQAEVDIVSVADQVVVVLTPESGDEVQSMKAGLLEIADVFVVNKADHPGAEAFAKHLQALAGHRGLRHASVPVVKTVATTGDGVAELLDVLARLSETSLGRQTPVLVEKLYRLIEAKRMHNVDRAELLRAIESEHENGPVNLYKLARQWA